MKDVINSKQQNEWCNLGLPTIKCHFVIKQQFTFRLGTTIRLNSKT